MIRELTDVDNVSCKRRKLSTQSLPELRNYVQSPRPSIKQTDQDDETYEDGLEPPVLKRMSHAIASDLSWNIIR